MQPADSAPTKVPEVIHIRTAVAAETQDQIGEARRRKHIRMQLEKHFVWRMRARPDPAFYAISPFGNVCIAFSAHTDWHESGAERRVPFEKDERRFRRAID